MVDSIPYDTTWPGEWKDGIRELLDSLSLDDVYNEKVEVVVHTGEKYTDVFAPEWHKEGTKIVPCCVCGGTTVEILQEDVSDGFKLQCATCRCVQVGDYDDCGSIDAWNDINSGRWEKYTGRYAT